MRCAHRDTSRSNVSSRFPRPALRPYSRVMTTRATTTQPEESTSNDPQRKHQSTWGIVAGASLVSTGLAADEIVPASVTPLIRDSLNIGPTIAGSLVGVMFGTAVITNRPAGAAPDRTDSRTRWHSRFLHSSSRVARDLCRVHGPHSSRSSRILAGKSRAREEPRAGFEPACSRSAGDRVKPDSATLAHPYLPNSRN